MLRWWMRKCSEMFWPWVRWIQCAPPGCNFPNYLRSYILLSITQYYLLLPHNSLSYFAFSYNQASGVASIPFAFSAFFVFGTFFILDQYIYWSPKSSIIIISKRNKASYASLFFVDAVWIELSGLIFFTFFTNYFYHLHNTFRTISIIQLYLLSCSSEVKIPWHKLRCLLPFRFAEELITCERSFHQIDEK